MTQRERERQERQDKREVNLVLLLLLVAHTCKLVVENRIIHSLFIG
jgi:hypothetical protein